MKHNANFKYDLEWGKQGETVVGEIQQGEKTEVKSERDKWIKTGNHYCEYQSRGKESGIKKTQAEWWTINFYSGDRFCYATVTSAPTILASPFTQNANPATDTASSHHLLYCKRPRIKAPTLCAHGNARGRG